MPHENRTHRPWATTVLLAAASVLCAGVLPAVAASFPAARGKHGMVVTPEPNATGVGVDILESGGNAVDAAVAVALVLAVTYPRAGNLGGGGFLLRRSSDGRYAALDFRETAPADLAAPLFLGSDGRPDPGLSLRGGLAVGVPGSVAGLADAHRRWGTLPWKDLVSPAIRLARRGFPIPWRTAELLREHTSELAADPAAREIFTLDGQPLTEGHVLVQRDLAATLRAISKHGADAFYHGKIADAVVRKIEESGGVMTAADLADYRPVLRTPLTGTYRGFTVVSFPPPSSGGIALIQSLAMLERLNLQASGPGSSLTIHRMVEAEKRAYADRAQWLGDPDFVDVPVEELLDPEYLASRSATIDDFVATPSQDIAHWEPVVPEPLETLHFSVVDPHGGAVSLTTTLNSYYGAALVADGTGFLLNNQIDDFSLAPGVPNQFGLVGGKANAVQGRKRPLSSMTPTIVDSDDTSGGPFLVVGTPGGSTITTTVLQVIVNIIDHRLPLQEAVDAPRLHHQWLPDEILLETRAIPADVRDALSRRGHRFRIRDPSRPLGIVAAILRAEDGSWLGAADPRGQGTAEGF